LADLSRKRDRERLSVRREPHWQRLDAGAYLGFRRGPDTWLVRYRARDGQQQYKSIGEAIDFDEAKRQAEDWLQQLTGSAMRSVTRSTVRQALEDYLGDLSRHGRQSAAIDALRRFKKVIYKDPLADIALERASRDDFEEWRDRQRIGRAARSLNRHVRSVVAGLNKALELGHVGNPGAWKLKALSDDTEEAGETAIFLSAQQRQALIAAATPWAAAFLRGLELTGARPQELANALVVDFDGSTLKLSHRKGKPPRLKSRHVVLGADGIKFFEKQAADKPPKAPIFTEDGETPWRRHMWARRIREAIAAHNENASGKERLLIDASAYSFRHARISELLQIYGVDPLTVAAQTGTSMVMIEKAYLRFIPNALREKLELLKESR
jgi:integrase